LHLADQVCGNQYDKHILPGSLILCGVSATHTDSSRLQSVSDTLGQSSRGAQGKDTFPEGIPAGGMQLGTESSWSGCERTGDTAFTNISLETPAAKSSAHHPREVHCAFCCARPA